MPVPTFAAAQRICEIGNWNVTNLKLQKVLYMAHMVHLGRSPTRGIPLVDGLFEAWDYGPVEPELYRKVRIFGDKPVQDIFFVGPLAPSSELEILNETCDRLLDKSPAQLVAMTHWEHGAWARNYQPGLSRVIPTQHIIAEYDARAR